MYFWSWIQKYLLLDLGRFPGSYEVLNFSVRTPIYGAIWPLSIDIGLQRWLQRWLQSHHYQCFCSCSFQNWTHSDSRTNKVPMNISKIRSWLIFSQFWLFRTYASKGRQQTGSLKLKDLFFNVDVVRKAGKIISGLHILM